LQIVCLINFITRNILGIGIDLVSIPRINRFLRKWGDRFKKKALREGKIRYSWNYGRSYEHFVVNFAVKEAFVMLF
jgi:phosphopantetheine--protein transferase-like protein